MRVAIIGAGWAGLAAAVAALQRRHQVTVFEASRQLGGRARSLHAQLPDGQPVTLDNGQHILIGAYTDTLALMRQVGVNPTLALKRLPLSLPFADGPGFALPDRPQGPVLLNVLAGVLHTEHWPWRERLALLSSALRWRLGGFRCAADWSVDQLTASLGPQVRAELIEPLCVSALNTPAHRASAQVFLRVLRDALFGVRGGSDLLLPRVDLGALLPVAAARWIEAHGGHLRLGQRVSSLQFGIETGSDGKARPPGAGRQTVWRVAEQPFDAVVLAASSSDCVNILSESINFAPANVAMRWQQWVECAQALSFESITTVYTWHPHARLKAPLLALRANAGAASSLAASRQAQFVFDRGQLGGPAGLLAWVVSAGEPDRSAVQAQVLTQARALLGTPQHVVQTVTEKRATFACTPGLPRPTQALGHGLWVCGDYVDGPYPATLEGAVRSGLQVAGRLE